MTDLDLAQALINALAECPVCGGRGRLPPLDRVALVSTTRQCPNCDGTGDYYSDIKSKELLAEWRKTHPKI